MEYTYTCSDSIEDSILCDSEKLLHEELTYTIRGALFEVHKKLGPVHKEKVYQNAIALELKKREIVFEREKRISIYYDNEKVGSYVPDFVVEQKVILEIKAVPFMTKKMEDQVWYYIQASRYRVALLANFGVSSLEIRRRVY